MISEKICFSFFMGRHTHAAPRFPQKRKQPRLVSEAGAAL